MSVNNAIPTLTNAVQNSRSSVNGRLMSMHGAIANGDCKSYSSLMKTIPLCSIIGCTSRASNKHHIGGASSPMIWVCRECHGRIHGLEWNSEHSALTRAGLAKARAQGRRGGNPKLLDGDRDFIDALAAARKEKTRQRILAGMNDWLPVVLGLRPRRNWLDVAAAVSQKTGVKWTSERLRRTVIRLMSDGLIDEKVMRRAPRNIVDDRVNNHLIPLIQSIAPGKNLIQIAAELQRRGERTTTGGSRWHASSVGKLLRSGEGDGDA